MKKKQPPGKSPRAASKAQLPLRPTGAAPSDAEPASGEPASPRQHLKLPEVLAELEAAAKALEVRLTYEAIGGELGAGGLCKVKGQWRVIIDKRTTPSERVSVLAQALSRFDFPRLRLSPQVHELLVRVAPAPEAAGSAEATSATDSASNADSAGTTDSASNADSAGTTESASNAESAGTTESASATETAGTVAVEVTTESAASKFPAEGAAAGTAASPPS
ncbi:MAG TPA: hypothetical protein PLW65_20000 [Pseudomonadota bacterium]|nr:hypothetical protein [Pseudomonadota bacterium]